MVLWDTCTKHLEAGNLEKYPLAFAQDCPKQDTDPRIAHHAYDEVILDDSPGVDILVVVVAAHIALAWLALA